MTTIDATNTFTLDGLAICPANDKDAFSITLGANTASVELVVTFDPVAVTLHGAIVNQGGVPIATAVPVSGMAGTIRANTQNLPSGLYFVVVSGPRTSSTAVNNYKLTINAGG